MPIITKISIQKKKGRYNVEIDESFAFGVSEILLARENLYKGLELSLQRVQNLQQASVEDKLYEKALNFLSYRPRSRREMGIYLKKKLLHDQKDIIETILTRLEKQSYLNDTEFAKWWVEQRTQSRNPKGLRLIKAELYQKGVVREVVDKALSQVDSEHLVKKAALKQAQRYKDLDTQIFKRRLSSYLLRRGFLWEHIKPVVDEIAK